MCLCDRKLIASMLLQTMNSMASAMCNLTFMPTSIKYSLSVMNIYAPTAAHIHMGAAGAEPGFLACLL